jgi:PAS domain S-box-containing protein
MPEPANTGTEAALPTEHRTRVLHPATGFAFLVGMFLIVLVGWTSYRQTTSLIESSSWISHTQQVIGDVYELQSKLEQAESTQGRYLMTGDESFLDSFQSDTKTTQELEETLSHLMADNPQQEARLRDLRRIIDRKIAHMNTMVEARRSRGQTPELAQALATEGKRRMEEVRRKISEIVLAETQLLGDRTKTQRRSAENSLRSILVGGTMALLFLALAGFALQRDVRKRLSVERRLQRTTALQRAILNSASYGIISTDAKGNIVHFNAAAERLFAYHSSEVIGRLNPVALHDPIELRKHAIEVGHMLGKPVAPGFESLVATAQLGPTEETEWMYTRRDGSRFSGLVSTSAMHDENGNISGYVFVVSDISARKEAEQEKTEIEQRYRALLKNSSDMVAVIDSAGRLQYLSPAVERLLGFSVPELMGREIFELIHSSDVDNARTAIDGIATHEGQSQPLAVRLRRADGEHIMAEIIGNNLLQDPVLHGIVLNARDISERSRARAQLEVQNAVARVLADAANLDASIPEILQVLCHNLDWELSEFWGVDHELGLLTFNFAWSLPGFDLRAFLEISQHTQIHKGEGLAGRVWEHATAMQVADISHEENFVRRTEVEALSLKTAVGFPIQSREAVIGVFTLFSLRPRHVDKDLLAMLNTVGAQIGQFIARKRAEQQISENEDRYHYLFENSADLIVSFAPDGKVLHLNASWLRTLGYSREEMSHLSFFELVAPEDTDSARSYVQKALASGSLNKVELSFRAHDGRQILTEGSINCRYGAAGVEYCNAIFQDVTKRREVDRMKNEFISVVSHELRTPLTSIRGSLGLLAGGAVRKDPEKADRMLDIALKNTERLVRLINDILDIEKIESGKISLDIQPIDAADLVTQASATMHAMAEANHVKLEAHPATGTVYADRDRMLQTLTNLLSNAIKFSKPQSTVSLISEKRGAGLLIRVRDQGRGIPSHKLQSIFERFQQVDASDSREKGGTGLGLAICRSIVQQHGGAIWVDSAEGKGSEFFVLLPRFQPESAAQGNPAGT